MAETGTVASRRLHEQVLNALVERIVAGEFPTGASLPSEAELCEAYGVSRSSIREALRVLAEKGLIEVRHGLGTRVNPPDRWDFLDALVLNARRRCGGMTEITRYLFEARQIVECEVAALAAQRATAADRERLEVSLGEMRRSQGDRGAFAEADFAFHRALLEATRNPVLVRMGAPIRELLEYSLQATASVPGILERILEQHAAIAGAVRDGNVSGARDAMRSHLESVAAEVESTET
jgi:DNA-binding FadR family transcriptional regulator